MKSEISKSLEIREALDQPLFVGQPYTLRLVLQEFAAVMEGNSSVHDIRTHTGLCEEECLNISKIAQLLLASKEL